VNARSHRRIRPSLAASAAAGLVLAVGLVLGLAGCTPAAPGNPVATFQVQDETYKIELATPELVDHVKQLLAGDDVAAIPNGLVVRDDPGPNEPWSWHIDPASLEFADATTEVCDGLPSHVEEATITSDRYCPWSAVVTDLDE
jgi:hypothetical protein